MINPHGDGNFGAEFEGLVKSPARKRLAGNAGRKSKVIFDTRRCPRLPAHRLGIQHNHRKPFRRSIDRSGQTRWPCPHHRDIIDFLGVKTGHDAKACGKFGGGRAPKDRPGGAHHQRQLVSQHAHALDQGAAFVIIARIEHKVGIAAAGRKSLEPDDFGSCPAHRSGWFRRRLAQ